MKKSIIVSLAIGLAILTLGCNTSADHEYAFLQSE